MLTGITGPVDPTGAGCTCEIGGGSVPPLRVGIGGGFVVLVVRCGSCTPVGGALRRRGGSGGSRRPHA